MQASKRCRPAAFAALLVGLAACSVTDYQQPITKFAAATKNAENALSALNTEVTSAYTGVLRERAISGEAFVEEQAGDCLFDSEHCNLQLSYSDPDKQPEPLTPPPALQNTIVLMASITTYANNLAALVSADTAAAVSANVNATIGSIGSLAETVEKAGGAKQTVDLSAYETPVGDAVRWLVGQYVASVKLDGLRRATAEAQPVIAEATRVFEIISTQAAVVPKATLAQAVEEQLAAFRKQRSAANLQQLVQSASQLNQLLEAKPSDVFAKMNAAHQALTNQLQNRDVTLPEAIARIESFAAEAEQLLKIARSFASAKTEG